jgi:hypothetical protein
MLRQRLLHGGQVRSRHLPLILALIACSSSDAARPGSDAGTTTPSDGGTTPATVDSGGAPNEAGGGAGPCALPNYPDEKCTGVPAGTSLQKVPAEVTSGPGWAWRAEDKVVEVKDDQAVFDAKDVDGCIVVLATGVTISNSKATCITVGQSDRARDPANPPLMVRDTEITCPDQDGTTALGDRNFRALRLNIHGCENGFDVDSDATIEDSFIHDLHQSQIAHTDGIQSAVGSNLVIRHNRFYAETPGACGTPSGHTADCGGTSAVNINNNPTGPLSTNTIVADNLLAGGSYSLYCPKVAPKDFKVTGNRFSKLFYPKSGAYGPSADCLEDNGTPRMTEWTGNVWDDTGAAIEP